MNTWILRTYQYGVGGLRIAELILFQNSVERSCRFSVVMAEDSAESFASYSIIRTSIHAALRQ